MEGVGSVGGEKHYLVSVVAFTPTVAAMEAQVSPGITVYTAAQVAGVTGGRLLPETDGSTRLVPSCRLEQSTAGLYC